VISGFLITGIIAADVRGGRYSIVAFYERRVRRIFPALFCMMALCAPVFAWVLFPDDLVAFASVVVATSLFASNLYFWKHSGYFDSAAELNPLTQTWSLAVEEQFYILFPLFLVVLLRARRAVVTTVSLGLLVASLALSALLLEHHARAAFYLPHSRAWELLLGAVLALDLLPPVRHAVLRSALGLAGVAGILGSAVLYSDRTPFPGPYALPPALGAALILYSGSTGTTLVGRVLSSRPLVAIGLVSYSLYLWHWPALVLCKHLLSVSHLPAGVAAGAVAFSGLAAVLSHRFVEQPFRDRARIGQRAILAGGGVAMAAAIATGVLIARLRGLPERFDATTVALLRDEQRWQKDPCINRTAADVTSAKLCRLGVARPGREDFLVWGDSHAGAMLSAFDAVAKATNRSGIYAVTGGCPPLLHVDRLRAWYGRGCLDFNDAVAEFAASPASPPTVIVVARWALWATGRAYKQEHLEPIFLADAESTKEGYDENLAVFERGLHRSLEALRRGNKRVVLVGPVPEIGFHVPKVLALEHRGHLGRVIAPTLSEFFEREKGAMPVLAREAASFGIQVLYPHELLCASGSCRVESRGLPLYRDDDHLSDFGNREIEPLVRRALGT
jgi:peptidoglycan/LPS O-acetylase OafA/YrhL